MEYLDAPETCLAEWEQVFRATALNDNNRILRAHLRTLDLPDKPNLLLDGTILVVRRCAAYLMLDNQLVVDFLEYQKYDPAQATDARYLVTFDICGKAFARIAMPIPFKHVDLADLNEAPWQPYKLAGYSQFFVSRVDGKHLTPDEIRETENAVTNDLRFDYDEDELEFWFDPDTIEGVLTVAVHDR